MPAAVLSACLTGIGEDSGPANNNSLVRSLLDAGVGSVLATRWQVDSAATASLMGDFYRQLGVAESIPEALASAIANLKTHPEFSHPYYWAAFQLYQ